ncbi:MAG TPA: hypothetical protein VES20_06130 [Bryobacteraceae bacterium]|nr:hypothetical protein [Bryobacteraceae bacterium]
MKINIETIAHGDQRYPTVGDYWDDPEGVVQVRVSDMKDWRYEALVVVHELDEMFLTKARNIAEQDISEFDMRFERSREEGLVTGEPGDHVNAPYRNEHFFATNLERLLSSELGVDWFEYDRVVDALGIKK